MTSNSKVLALVAAVLILSTVAPTAVVAAPPALEAALDAVRASAGANDAVKAYAAGELASVCTDPAVVAAVAAQNAKGTDLAAIQATDTAWAEAEDELPIQVELLSNACAQALKAFADTHPAVLEVFVMDDQGANVGQNALTSDYWQGDEAKWQNAYNGGQGGAEIGAVEYDRSANTQLQQISLPVVADDGTVIGAVTFGIAVERVPAANVQ